jgi:hypothetical protein
MCHNCNCRMAEILLFELAYKNQALHFEDIAKVDMLKWK